MYVLGNAFVGAGVGLFAAKYLPWMAQLSGFFIAVGMFLFLSARKTVAPKSSSEPLPEE